MSETSEEKPSHSAIILNALAALVRAGESPDTERWANVRRDVVCREVIKIRDANDAQRKELASLRSTVAALTAKLEAVSKERDEAENARIDAVESECRKSMLAEFDIEELQAQLAAANKEIERLKELVFAVKETLHPQAWKYHQPSHSPPIEARFFDLNEAIIKVCGPNWEGEHEAAVTALLAQSEAEEVKGG